MKTKKMRIEQFLRVGIYIGPLGFLAWYGAGPQDPLGYFPSLYVTLTFAGKHKRYRFLKTLGI